MPFLNEWSLLEGEHISSLSGAEKDLEASTLRVPVAGGAKVREPRTCQFFEGKFWHHTSLNIFILLQVDVGTLKAAVCSAVDVMQTMGSSICSLLSRVSFLFG